MTTNGLPPIEDRDDPERLAYLKALVRFSEASAPPERTFQQLDMIDQVAWMSVFRDYIRRVVGAEYVDNSLVAGALLQAFAAGHNYAMKYGALWRPPAGEAADHAD